MNLKSMQSQKKFVKYTNFNVSTPTNRDSRRPSKKNYYQKIIGKGDAVKSMVNAFTINTASGVVKQLIKNFPKFFSAISKYPDKQKQENLNDFLVFNLGKRTQQAKLFENESSDDPDWQSGSQGDFKLQSKKIDEKIIQKVSTQTVVPLIKNELKKHQEEFLEDYLKSKNKTHEQQTHQTQKKNNNQAKQKNNKQINNSEKVIDNNQFQQWLNLGQNGSGGCWIQKIEEDADDAYDLESGQDDGMFDRESQGIKSSTSSDEDDGFVDETTSNTTLHTNKNRNKTEGSVGEKSKQGIIYINSYVFSNIAQQIGILPQHCVWQISNHKLRYKVSTQYMDQIYYQNHINKEYPYIALNQSQFVHNDDALTPKSVQIFKNQHKKTINQKKYKEVDRKSEKQQKNTYPTHKKK